MFFAQLSVVFLQKLWFLWIFFLQNHIFCKISWKQFSRIVFPFNLFSRKPLPQCNSLRVKYLTTCLYINTFFLKDSGVKCKARVHESREAAQTRGLDHGVNPSVGLGKLSLSLCCVRSKFIMFEVLKIILCWLIRNKQFVLASFRLFVCFIRSWILSQ